MPLLGRDVSVTGSFPPGLFVLETFHGSERLGQPFVYDLGLLSKDPVISDDDILGQSMAIGIRLANGSKRLFQGVVTDSRKTGATRLHTRYAARVNPCFGLFDYTLDCRVEDETTEPWIDPLDDEND